LTSSRVDKTLYLSALFATLIAAGAVVWSLAARRPPPQYAVGDRFDGVPAVDLKAGPSTLVIWVSSRCGACTASMPFYRQLTAGTHRARLVVMGQEPVDLLQDYVDAFGVRPAQVISTGDSSLKFVGTPTLLLIGQDSIVRSVWYGRRKGPVEELDIIRRVE
jgi:hypothetical protein